MTDARVDCASLAAVYEDGVDVYDAIWSPVIWPPAASVIDTLELEASVRVLDVGAGTGALSDALTAAAPRGFRVRRRVFANAALRPGPSARRRRGRRRDTVAVRV